MDEIIRTEDADVPALAVKGLNEATRKARLAGDVVVVREGRLIKISPNGAVEFLQAAPNRVKVTTRTKRLKR